jgi:hypothetical protein
MANKNATAVDAEFSEVPVVENKGWHQVGRPHTVKVTRKLALDHAQMDAAPGDRALSERRMELYTRFVKQKTFRSFEWARAYCKETRKRYRVNGKHTSTLLGGWSGALPELYVTITDFSCDTLADVAHLYSTFDSVATVRRPADINKMFATAVPELTGVQDHLINRMVAGINYAPTKEHYARTLEERAEVLLTEWPFVVWFVQNMYEGIEIDARSKQRMLLRGPVLGAMFGTYKRDKEAAKKFWLEVRDATAPSEGAVTRRLERYLRESTLHRERTRVARDNAVPTDTRAMWSKCAIAWNAWRKGRPSELRYYPAQKQELVIE